VAISIGAIDHRQHDRGKEQEAKGAHDGSRLPRPETEPERKRGRDEKHAKEPERQPEHTPSLPRESALHLSRSTLHDQVMHRIAALPGAVLRFFGRLLKKVTIAIATVVALLGLGMALDLAWLRDRRDRP
jgi:hypothetical protein